MKKSVLFLSLFGVMVLFGFESRRHSGSVIRIANKVHKTSGKPAFFNIGLLAEQDDWSDCVQRDYSLWGGETGDTFEWYIEWAYQNHPGWGRQFICTGESMPGWDLDAGDVVVVRVTPGNSDPVYEVWEGITECEE
jgi:hypothetical protein